MSRQFGIHRAKDSYSEQITIDYLCNKGSGWHDYRLTADQNHSKNQEYVHRFFYRSYDDVI
jgi:hypothetical protein